MNDLDKNQFPRKFEWLKLTASEWNGWMGLREHEWILISGLYSSTIEEKSESSLHYWIKSIFATEMVPRTFEFALSDDDARYLAERRGTDKENNMWRTYNCSIPSNLHSIPFTPAKHPPSSYFPISTWSPSEWDNWCLLPTEADFQGSSWKWLFNRFRENALRRRQNDHWKVINRNENLLK